MWRRPEAIVVAALIVGACKRDAPAPAAKASEPPASEAPIADASVSEADAATPEIPRELGGPPEHVARAKSIGHTSVVFKVEMREGTKYVFKPRSRRGPDRYRGEIAAFRLGALLGIGDALPKAYPRSFTRRELIAGADDKAQSLLADDVLFDANDAVTGALMPWIDDYAVVPLEKEPLFSEWRAWLKKGAPIPDDKRGLAREVSTLVLFDFVTANWDRWSGANVASSRGKLLYVDNDGAFFESPPKDALARNERYLRAVERFSRSFVERLRAVREEDLARALDILSKKAIDGVLARRKEALAIVAEQELFFD